MPLPHLRAAGLALAVALAVPAAALASKKLPVAADPEATIVHVLNRLGFGPRPGDVAKVRAMGLDKWIDQQLHPERIADPAVATRLGPLRSLHLSTGGLIARHPLRPHAWGKFEDLLRATAESPAMLFYLDNWLSADPNAQPAELRDRPPRGRLGRGPFGRRPWFMGDRPAAAPPGQGKGQKRGLNENY